MFDSLLSLKNGNLKQQDAYTAIMELNILDDLAHYSPLICGTIPLDIDHTKSDIDIVLEAKGLPTLMTSLKRLYGHLPEWKSTQKIIRENHVLVTSFYFKGFEFQLFGQNVPTKEQYAYLHMLIEWKILQENPEWKEKIRQMKKDGIKTEPAFCFLLQLDGDPYEALLHYGRSKEWIT
jgi:hypothetical protein